MRGQLINLVFFSSRCIVPMAGKEFGDELDMLRNIHGLLLLWNNCQGSYIYISFFAEGGREVLHTVRRVKNLMTAFLLSGLDGIFLLMLVNMMLSDGNEIWAHYMTFMLFFEKIKKRTEKNFLTLLFSDLFKHLFRKWIEKSHGIGRSNEAWIASATKKIHKLG